MHQDCEDAEINETTAKYLEVLLKVDELVALPGHAFYSRSSRAEVQTWLQRITDLPTAGGFNANLVKMLLAIAHDRKAIGKLFMKF